VRLLTHNCHPIGAIYYEVERNKQTGQLAGKKLILVNPEEWAKESPLKIDINTDTERRENNIRRIQR